MQTLAYRGNGAANAAIVAIAIIVITAMMGQNRKKAEDARTAKVKRVQALVSEASELGQSSVKLRSSWRPNRKGSSKDATHMGSSYRLTSQPRNDGVEKSWDCNKLAMNNRRNHHETNR